MPVAVSGVSTVTAVAAGGYHTLALRAAACSNVPNQDAIPSQMPTRAQQSASTSSHRRRDMSVILGSLSEIVARPELFNGQLGDTTTTTQRPTPVVVANQAGVAAIAAGEAFSLAVLADRTVWAWGLNTNGQVGDGITIQRKTPVVVEGLSGVIAAGRVTPLTTHNFQLTTSNSCPTPPRRGPRVSAVRAAGECPAS